MAAFSGALQGTSRTPWLPRVSARNRHGMSGEPVVRGGVGDFLVTVCDEEAGRVAVECPEPSG